jgi:hypothetical protein
MRNNFQACKGDEIARSWREAVGTAHRRALARGVRQVVRRPSWKPLGSLWFVQDVR